MGKEHFTLKFTVNFKDCFQLKNFTVNFKDFFQMKGVARRLRPPPGSTPGDCTKLIIATLSADEIATVASTHALGTHHSVTIL
jgi:hypothetical protein